MKQFSLWEAGEGQFDRNVPEDGKHQEDHDRSPHHNEQPTQQLEPKPYPMALNLHTKMTDILKTRSMYVCIKRSVSLENKNSPMP